MTDRAASTSTGALGVVVHPRRPIDRALGAVAAWAEEHDRPLGQVRVAGQDRLVAEPIDVADCALLVAVGGDGTVLGALRAAAPVGVPVLGVACGSLGALTSVAAPDVGAALDRIAAGDAVPRDLPALHVTRDGEEVGHAFNDVVLVRAGAGQVILDVDVGGAPYARMAGDGVVVATPLGSSAYTLAAGGPLVAVLADLLVVTPLSPHAGSIPPVVLDADAEITLRVDAGWGGARIELDGRVAATQGPAPDAEPFVLELALRPAAARLLDLDGETLVAGLRRRGVIADSPRLRARDARAG